MLDLRDTTINVMVLAGLVVAIGVVVDDAIIDVENIVRRLRQARAEGLDVSTFKVVLDASVEVRSAITYATMINVVAIVPVFFLEGLSGSFFQPLVLSYGLAVLVSMLVALTVTPALCLLMLSRGNFRSKESPLLSVLKRGYGAILARVIRRPSPAILTAAVCLLAGLLIYPSLGSQLLPNFKERDFLMHWLTEPSTGAEEEKRISIRACKDLREIPGVRNCGSHIGQALMSDEVYGVYFGENWISVDKDVDYDDTLAKVHRTVEGYPGLYRDVQTYLRERIKEVLTGTSESVVVRIFGPELPVLREKADEITEKIADIDGVIDVSPDFAEELPHVTVELDLDSGAEVRGEAGRHAPADLGAARQRGGQRHLPRRQGVRRARVEHPVGARQPLRRGGSSRSTRRAADTCASTRWRTWASSRRRTTSSARSSRAGSTWARTWRARDLASAVEDVEDRLEEIEMPPGYHAEVLGESTELNAAQDRLYTFGIGAAIAIFLLLQAAFGSLRLAALTFLLLPMALVGGVLAVKLGDGILSLGSLVGFLTVFGIAARNGILMISHFQHLERKEGMPFGPGAGAARCQGAARADHDDGARDRPGARAAGGCGQHPGHEIEHPMAIVILGGLFTSTLLNLFVLPSLYLRFAKSRKELAGGSRPAPA